MIIKQAIRVIATLCFFQIASVTAAPITAQGTWETTLLARDLDGNPATVEAYYDQVRDVTWLVNANLAASQTFGIATHTFLIPNPDPFLPGYGYIENNGSMDWTAANMWTDSMNQQSYLGRNDWRLPTIDDLYSLNAQTLGNSGYSYPWNTGPFENLRRSLYWSSETLSPSEIASFNFGSVSETKSYLEVSRNYVLPLFSGDSIPSTGNGDASEVPEPPVLGLLGAAFLITLISRKKKKSISR